MSLDISVTNTRTEETKELNWLRNPFGLERWARANYLYEKKEEPTPNLWDVCNQWNYDKAEQVDKPLFLATVKQYGEVILALEQGYFWFDVSAYIHFIQPHFDVFPTHNPMAGMPHNEGLLIIKGSTHCDRQIGIPMEYFAHSCFNLSSKHRPDAHTLARYQTWYQELIDLAEMLQDPDAIFYCSN